MATRYTEDFFFEKSKRTAIRALEEDLGRGDVSAQLCVPAEQKARAVLYAKQSGIISGVRLAAYLYTFDRVESMQVRILKSDGMLVRPGDAIMEVLGSARRLLERERTALNFVQRMSGIATLTQDFVSQIHPFKTQLMDTRKTAPGLRFTDKWAVFSGGGSNHRLGLYDAVMLKENHIDYCGGLARAIEKLAQYRREHKEAALPIIVEARNFEEYIGLSTRGRGVVDRILLDNFSPAEVRRAVETKPVGIDLEASGGISRENVKAYAATGVHCISIGSLTHSVKAFDLSVLSE